MTHPILARYETERPLYEKTCSEVRERLRSALMAAGILAEVEGRTKEPDSLVKKCVRKGRGYDEVSDKAGVRVLLIYPGDRESAATCVRNTFSEIEEIDDKASKQQSYEFQYNALHFTVRTEPGGLLCEVQLHTPGLALWAKLSHDLTYKAPPDLPSDSTRSINRLMALCEIIDLEAERVRRAVLCSPLVSQSQILLCLEKHFYRYAHDRYDEQLSLSLLGELMPLAGDSEDLIRQLDVFCSERGETIEWVFTHRKDSVRRPLLMQPESILIFYLLERDRLALEDSWPERLTESDFNMYCAVWGDFEPIEDGDVDGSAH